MTRPKAGDIIIFALYALLTMALILLGGRGGNILEIETEEGSFAYALDNDAHYSFSGPLGTTEIEIKDGRARIVSSPCPGQDCVRSGWGTMLCCLPNRIIVQVRNEGGGADAVSG